MAARLRKDEAGRSGMAIPLLFYHRATYSDTTEKAVAGKGKCDTHVMVRIPCGLCFPTHLLEGLREAGKLSKPCSLGDLTAICSWSTWSS